MSPIFHMITGAPDPVAPFSHAVEADGWVFVTGQMPFVGSSLDTPYPEGIEAQTRQMTGLAKGARIEIDLVARRGGVPARAGLPT